MILTCRLMMSGSAFATNMIEYARLHTVKTCDNENANCGNAVSSSKSRINIIRSNPDKSKHLETARFQFHSFVIDVCALRLDNCLCSALIFGKLSSLRHYMSNIVDADVFTRRGGIDGSRIGLDWFYTIVV